MTVGAPISRTISSNNLAASKRDAKYSEETVVFTGDVMKFYLGSRLFNLVNQPDFDITSISKEDSNTFTESLLRWAEDNNCQHFSHWFAPLTNRTANKIVSLRTPNRNEMEQIFDSSQLVSETDGSSFPNGGLRSTMEARGLTTYDSSSPPYIKETAVGRTLIIPSTFKSGTGASLDHRLPLHRSTEYLRSVSKEIVQILQKKNMQGPLKLDSDVPVSYVGPEQEYFLVSKDIEREDLRVLGRCIFGELPYSHPHHYFCEIPANISSFLHEVDEILKEKGVPVSLQHNEVAPNQFELGVIHGPAAQAADWNLLIKDTLEELSDKHGFKCILHPKPFAGVNGSGMHTNFSISIGGVNAFNPPKESGSNTERALFLLAIAAVVRAVNIHAGLIRCCAASASNDLRLGGHEAPPGIISIFLGDGLSTLMESLEKMNERDISSMLQSRTRLLNSFNASNSDRNRTSPFAFNGQRFEYRAPSSQDSVAFIMTVIQTTIADSLNLAINEIDRENPLVSMVQIASAFYQENKNIVYNYNNYSEKWQEEAQKRGLPVLPDTVTAHEAFTKPESIELFRRTGVMTADELEARLRVRLSEYAKEVENEVSILIDMCRRYAICDAYRYLAILPQQSQTYQKLTPQISSVETQIEDLQNELETVSHRRADFEDDPISVCFTDARAMCKMRKHTATLSASVTKLGKLVGSTFWTIPTLEEILTF